jgi:ATP-dependent Clp protease ATP-binding subunit ClpA
MLKSGYAFWPTRALLELPLRIAGPIKGMRGHGLVVAAVRSEDMRLAWRLGHARASSAHLLCALLDVDEQIERSEGVDLPPDIAAHNTAGVVLRNAGVTLTTLIVATADLPDEAEAALPKRGTFAGPARRYWSESSEKACRNADELARSLRHRRIGTTHLLAGCLATSDGPAFRLLAALGTDPAAIREETKCVLGLAS